MVLKPVRQTGLFLFAAFGILAAVSNTFAADSDVVVFPDPNLQSAIEQQLALQGIFPPPSPKPTCSL